MDSGVMTRKPVADILKVSREGPSLAKSRGLLSIVALGVGDIIGAGIFVLTGTAAAQFAGPSVMLSFALGGIVCGLIGLCYAELSAMLPVSGSTYSYTYATLGELVAWIIGWDLVLEYATGTAAVAVGWSSYATSMLRHAGLTLPLTLTAATGTAVKLPDGSTVTGIANLQAVLVVAALTALLILGTSESAKLNNVMVAIKLAVVLAFIGVGAFYVDPAHWHPFIPANTGGFGHLGYSGLLRGSAVVFFAFLGFDVACTAAQEARNPQRDMPVGILGGGGSLHRALCRGRRRADGHRALRPAQRRRPRGQRRGGDRAALVLRPDRTRRATGPDHRDPGVAVWLQPGAAHGGP